MSNEQTVETDAALEVRVGDNFSVTPAGLTIAGKPTFEAFDALGETLSTLDKSIQFAIGDYFQEVETRFGERASQLLDHERWSEETIRNYRWIADSVPKESRRMDVLTISHHQRVAKLPPAQQKKMLDRAAEGENGQPWSVSRLTAAIKAGGEDRPVTQWVLVAFFDTESARDAQLSALQAKGISCRASERRGEKAT